jgi:hypothetical protein
MYLIDSKLLKNLQLTNIHYFEIENMERNKFGPQYDATIGINNVLSH